MKYYEVHVEWRDENGDKVKKFTERYLVFAVSVTDAEVRVTKVFGEEESTSGVEFNVKLVKESSIVRVFEVGQ